MQVLVVLVCHPPAELFETDSFCGLPSGRRVFFVPQTDLSIGVLAVLVEGQCWSATAGPEGASSKLLQIAIDGDLTFKNTQ